LWEGEGPSIKGAQFKFECAGKISGIFGKRDPEKPGISRDLEIGNKLETLHWSIFL